MRVEYEQTKAAVVCHLIGNLESLTVEMFRNEVAQLGRERVIFDMAAVPFVDSAGLGALIGVVRRVRESDGEAVVCGARASVARVLDLVGFNRVVAITKDVDAAKAYFSTAA